MDTISTIKDVAQCANVSITTVSRYLNGSKNVSAQVAQRIEAAVAQTGYQPNQMARSLKTQKSLLIALVVPDICNPFYSLMAKTVQRIARENGYVTSFCDTNEDTLNEIVAITTAQQLNAAGILFAAIDMKQQVVDQMQRSRIPVVGLNAYSKSFPYDCVHVPESGGTYIAMQHLLENGHRRIVFAGGAPSSMIEISRRQGYERAMREHGLTFGDEDIFEMGFAQEDGFKAGKYFSTFNPLPTAICCANDQIAMGVINALQDAGLSVPDDVSITGMDDIPYGRTSKPSLTTVKNDGAEYAVLGMELLLSRINGQHTGEKRELAVPNTLLPRRSVRSICAE